MSLRLEAPYSDGILRSAHLYLAKGDEIVPGRPILTGDIFQDVQLEPGSSKSPRMVMMLHHPCSMRRDGIKLRSKLLVAKVDKVNVWGEGSWQMNYAYMGLPGLGIEAPEGKHWAVNFNELYTVSPASLTNRSTCLSNAGINILLQRWVHFSSRVVVPTFDFQTATEPFFEETELMETWCDEFEAESEEDVQAASKACLEWLRNAPEGQATPQERLKYPQERSGVRRDMNRHIRSLLKS